MKKGDPVRIVKSHHSSIEPGRTGVIESAFDGGYGVRVTGQFFVPEAVGKFLTETRTVWFPKEWVVTIDAEELEPPDEVVSCGLDERLFGQQGCVSCDALVRVAD